MNKLKTLFETQGRIDYVQALRVLQPDLALD